MEQEISLHCLVFKRMNSLQYRRFFTIGVLQVGFPVQCSLSKSALTTPVVNHSCPKPCYFSANKLIQHLNDQLKPYTCPSCSTLVHSKDLVYDPGLEHHLQTFNFSRNKMIFVETFYLNKDDAVTQKELKRIPEVEKVFEDERVGWNMKALEKDHGTMIDGDAMTRAIQKACADINPKEITRPVIVARGVKNITQDGFLTMIVTGVKGELVHLKMTVKGQKYMLPKDSQIKFSKQLSSFYIVANHQKKLVVLKAHITNLRMDVLEFQQIASFNPRAEFGVAIDQSKLYIVGGEEKEVALKEVYRVDLVNGSSDKLPPMTVERCMAKALAVEKRLYVFGGSSKKDKTYGLLPNSQYFDFATNKWTPINLAEITGLDIGAIAGSTPNIIIVYGGTKTVNNTETSESYFYLNTTTHSITQRGTIKETSRKQLKQGTSLVVFDRLFDNNSLDQSVLRFLFRSRQEVARVQFKENGGYTLTKEMIPLL